MNTQDDLLEYYRRELNYLRTQSADFAARYPKVAQRLVLTGGETADPHTEHLIESVAFLSARVHRELDRDFPTVANAMLDNLCPSLTQPVPAMTVMQLTPDPTEGKATAGIPVARGTMLSATAVSGEQCRFQVAWNTTLWPLRVTSHSFSLRKNVTSGVITLMLSFRCSASSGKRTWPRWNSTLATSSVRNSCGSPVSSTLRGARASAGRTASAGSVDVPNCACMTPFTKSG